MSKNNRYYLPKIGELIEFKYGEKLIGRVVAYYHWDTLYGHKTTMATIQDSGASGASRATTWRDHNGNIMDFDYVANGGSSRLRNVLVSEIYPVHQPIAIRFKLPKNEENY